MTAMILDLTEATEARAAAKRAASLRRHIKLAQGRIGRAHGAHARADAYARLAGLQAQLAAADAGR